MKNTFLKYIKISLALLLFCSVGKVEAQNNLTMKSYTGQYLALDGAALDASFGTVTIDGTVVTSAYTPSSSFATIPTTVAGFGGVQVVWIDGYVNNNITKAQADALIDYVKGGGILVGNLEGSIITTTGGNSLKYIGEALFCNTVTLTPTPADSGGTTNSPAYHPGNGALLLNTGASTVFTTSSYSSVTGLPSENVVYSVSATTSCATTQAMDFVIPAYPGLTNSCGVNGMALLSGELHGILIGNTYRLGSQSNKNYAQLMYDFLYNPTAMATRRAWSTISTNKNTVCAPTAAPCQVAPTLSATTATAACPANTVNLNSLVTSTLPSNNTLKWYKDNTHTTEVTAPASVGVSGTYYAFYVDTANNCYSPASAAVTVTANCPINVATVCPAVSIDLSTRVTSGTLPTGYTYTYHSGTPATTANKLSSPVVSTSGTYYLSAYFATQDCYATTSRPMVVTITNCCAAVAAPNFN